MKKSTRNTLAALAVAATGTYMLQDKPPYTTYIHGSANVPHDIYYGLQVQNSIKFGLYCSMDDVHGAKPGDVAITMRAGSAIYSLLLSD